MRMLLCSRQCFLVDLLLEQKNRCWFVADNSFWLVFHISDREDFKFVHVDI